ncbi:MAG TPA: DUF465 domain-containing protein [Flavobacterium sp.]|jgi:hypothetical protein|nr:DUF465 domain-containing protein [Flavobacterium sp.]
MDKHDLLHEFPEYQERMHELKLNDPQFKKLYDEYHDVEHQVHLMKTDEVVVTDEALKELKARLLHLKDDIFSRLKNYA